MDIDLGVEVVAGDSGRIGEGVIEDIAPGISAGEVVQEVKNIKTRTKISFLKILAPHH